MRIAHLFAVAAMAGSLSFAGVSSSQAAGVCRSDMVHLMGSHMCSQRFGCLRTHLQMLSKGCLTKLSFRASQRMRMKHHMG